MNEPIPFQGTDRATGAAQFFSRVQRYKTLLKRRWWVLLLTLGIAVGAQTYRASQAPLTYVSSAQMIVGNRAVLADANSSASEESFVGTTIALLKGNLITSRAAEALKVKQPGLKPSPVLIDVSLVPKTTIFLLQARGGEPNYTRAFLDTLMEEFLNYRHEMRGKSTEETLRAITEQHSKAQGDILAAQKDLAAFQTTNNIAFVEQQALSAGQRVSSLENELAQKQMELSLLESMTSLPVAATSASDKPDAAQNELRDRDQARRQLGILKAERDELAQFLRPQHWKMIKLEQQIASQETLLKIFDEQTKEQLDNRRNDTKRAIAALQSALVEQRTRALEASHRDGEVRMIRSRIQSAETLYGRISSMLDQVKIGKEVPTEVIQVLEPAALAAPDNSGFTKNIVIGCFVGLVFGIGLLFLLDRFDDRPVSFTELQEHFDEMVLGQIPQDATRSRDRKLLPLTANDTRYAYAEAHRNLRSSLIFMAIEGARPRTIVITSAVPGEGKSTVAVNLGITMAFAGSRVLLVDADMRKGTVHEYFETTEGPGLAEVLAGEMKWDAVIQQTHVPNLHLLPRGSFPANPGELILSGVEALIREVYQHFDFVLFDSAPVLAADDTASLAPKVDGTLFVIRAAYTSARLARNALDVLYQRQVNVMGLVFNSVESSSREYYYFKYPEYYSKKLVHR